NYQTFETGSVLRKIAASGSEVGNKVKERIEHGKLVDTDLIMDVIGEWLDQQETKDNIIFDGIPRSEEQRVGFEKLMNQHDMDFLPVLIDITENESRYRLGARRICQSCNYAPLSTYTGEKCPECEGDLAVRADDADPEAIEQRLSVYRDETLPMVQQYEKVGKVLKADGMLDIQDIYQTIADQL
ncbi:MAG: nucleoside monophosphate kinase, partial [Patescibacteria group bacterium]|nr:nucleoside monophosphate kinase [Patescibacteria group bacterium]